MELKFILESLLFSAQKPLSIRELREVLGGAADAEDADATVKAVAKTKEPELTAALEELAREHETAARSYRLVCVAGAWQFVSQPEFAPWLKALVGHKNRPAKPFHTGPRDPCHHRLSPADHARRSRAGARRGCGRRHPDPRRARID